tara:strand:+ start:250 stop:447 length:198 start_codon:yes stop_codon:yes gene_type:complete
MKRTLSLEITVTNYTVEVGQKKDMMDFLTPAAEKLVPFAPLVPTLVFIPRDCIVLSVPLSQSNPS